MKCIDCEGEGRTPNGSCTGDAAGGWADTCDTCKGTGDMPPAPCPHCNAQVKVYRESRIAEWDKTATWQVRCEQCWCAAPLAPTPEYAVDAWNDLFSSAPPRCCGGSKGEMMYYGNSTLGFDEPDTPMVFLQCGFCPVQMGYAGTVTGDTHTLTADETLECDCGATYGEGDTLEVVPETNCRDDDYGTPEEYYQEFYSDADLPF